MHKAHKYYDYFALHKTEQSYYIQIIEEAMTFFDEAVLAGRARLTA